MHYVGLIIAIFVIDQVTKWSIHNNMNLYQFGVSGSTSGSMNMYLEVASGANSGILNLNVTSTQTTGNLDLRIRGF